jgi:hypothetical protein
MRQRVMEFERDHDRRLKKECPVKKFVTHSLLSHVTMTGSICEEH